MWFVIDRRTLRSRLGMSCRRVWIFSTSWRSPAATRGCHGWPLPGREHEYRLHANHSRLGERADLRRLDAAESARLQLLNEAQPVIEGNARRIRLDPVRAERGKLEGLLVDARRVGLGI